MYTYIVDIRYPKGIECEDPCTVHNELQVVSEYWNSCTWLVDNHVRSEILVEFDDVRKADRFAIELKTLKDKLSSECVIDCYIVSGKWRV